MINHVDNAGMSPLLWAAYYDRCATCKIVRVHVHVRVCVFVFVFAGSSHHAPLSISSFLVPPRCCCCCRCAGLITCANFSGTAQTWVPLMLTASGCVGRAVEQKSRGGEREYV